MRRIYLDHTATTPLDDRVFEAMRPYFSQTFGNASSVHAFGREAKSALEKARETLAKAIGAHSGEVFFTSGGTESDNFAIRGFARAGLKGGKNHIITSAAEHHAVLEPCEILREEGFDVTILPVDVNGLVSPDQVMKAITDRTCLVSIMHANNEVGSVSPIKEIVKAAHERGVVVHTDAVQTLGKIPLDVAGLGVDLMTISAHKLYGPKGIGALYAKKGTELEPMLHGGGQERGKRPGTENVPLAAGFAKAVELAVYEMPDEMKRLASLCDNLQSQILNRFPAAIINGHPTNRLPHILNISFDSSKIQLEGEMLVMNMDLEGIAVTSGSACTSGSMQPSHVLLAMGRDAKTARATLRFAFGKSNATEDIACVVEKLGGVLKRMTRQ
ncbi:MAG: cysteine desulfurase [Bacteroidetes bacterium]|nr:cysteine desulfurase [Bacteroidota bacterium]MCW5894291.1 cysteine desulfurase [Bacteroidota bacterium]